MLQSSKPLALCCRQKENQFRSFWNQDSELVPVQYVLLVKVEIYSHFSFSHANSHCGTFPYGCAEVRWLLFLLPNIIVIQLSFLHFTALQTAPMQSNSWKTRTWHWCLSVYYQNLKHANTCKVCACLCVDESPPVEPNLGERQRSGETHADAGPSWEDHRLRSSQPPLAQGNTMLMFGLSIAFRSDLERSYNSASCLHWNIKTCCCM